MSGSKESEKSITSYSVNSNKTSQSNDEHHDGVENKVHDNDSMDSISSFVTMDDDGRKYACRLEFVKQMLIIT
jgi:hypothetical protein